MTREIPAAADTVIVGGGHNGFCAFYLARAGRSVVVLEQGSVVGGACVTEELFPGARFSTCANILWQLQPTVEDDMALASHCLPTTRSRVASLSCQRASASSIPRTRRRRRPRSVVSTPTTVRAFWPGVSFGRRRRRFFIHISCASPQRSTNSVSRLSATELLRSPKP